MRRYAITAEIAAGSGAAEEAAVAELRALAEEWIAGGVDYIQLRQKGRSAAEVRRIAETIFPPRASGRRRTKLLINCPREPSAMKLLAGVADGLHLPGTPQAGDVRRVLEVFRSAGRDPVVSLPCHNLAGVITARSEAAGLILYAPVFEKPGVGTGQGLEALRLACEAAGSVPVFALGGVTPENAGDCEAAGAAGVAGIRLFAGDGWRNLARRASCEPESGDEPIL